MPTLLHISDLHRTSGPRIDNDHLLTALSSDAGRWEFDGIPWPDLIIVSGDLIQGAAIDDPDADHKVQQQYEEAGEFLGRLTDIVVGGDRSRVILVPGNHDVHWSRSKASMELIDEITQGIATMAFDPSSGVRWDWKNQNAYRIKDESGYSSRFDHFRSFRSEFYKDVDPFPLPDDSADIIFANYEALGLVVVGFASWHGNDCFCPVGDIDSAALAVSQKLLATSRSQVAIAVWHHGVMGGPRANDYMDQRVIHRLIDLGFSVGMHGHHHSPAAAPFEITSPNETSMALVSAGSLAVGNRELPEGELRQFNIVNVDHGNQSVTIHVRAMSPAGVFGRSHRDDFGGSSFKKLSLPSSPTRALASADARLLDDALTAARLGQHEDALVLASKLSASRPLEARQINIAVLEDLNCSDGLIELFDPPRNTEEAVHVVRLLCDVSRFHDASARLQQASTWLDQTVAGELKIFIESRKALT